MGIYPKGIQMKTQLSKDKFHEVFCTLSHIYSHFSDKDILYKAVNKLEDSTFQELYSKQDLSKLFYVLNKHIDEKDIVLKLCEIESYSNIMELALAGIENSSDPRDDANDLKVLNMQTKKLIRELIVMFEEKEFLSSSD